MHVHIHAHVHIHIHTQTYIQIQMCVTSISNIIHFAAKQPCPLEAEAHGCQGQTQKTTALERIDLRSFIEKSWKILGIPNLMGNI